MITMPPGSHEAQPTYILSAIQHPDVIEDYIMKECAKGRLLGPFKRKSFPLVHCSPFGVIPKKGQDSWRMIVDLSAPKGGSINDGIDESLASLSYIAVEMAADKVLQLGRHTLMAKTDVKSAFRIIPVHTDDWHLLGLEWKGSLYIDTVLPFGLRSAPKLFSVVADALQFIAHSYGGIEFIAHYLDDFLILGRPGSDECVRALSSFEDLCGQLGVPLASEKTAGPTTVMEFLGIVLDSEELTMSLPSRKLMALKSELQGWLGRKGATKRELQSLAGSLQHAAKVVRPGRCFTYQVHKHAALRDKPYHRIRLNRSDVQWWFTFIEQWNGVSLLWNQQRASPDVLVVSDPSGSWGCAALSENAWLQHSWLTAMKGFSIAHQELIPIIFAAIVWGYRWSQKTVQFICDNQAVVTVLNKTYCQDGKLMHLLRCLVFLAAKYQFWFTAAHIPGRVNILADALSRNDNELFYAQAPVGMNQEPDVVPGEAPQLLYLSQPDWLSRDWNQLFTAITRQA